MVLFVMLCEFVSFSNRRCYIDITTSTEINGRRLVKDVPTILPTCPIRCFTDLASHKHLDVGCVR
jgi:hypothetical protein